MLRKGVLREAAYRRGPVCESAVETRMEKLQVGKSRVYSILKLVGRMVQEGLWY
jgi:hypothetical protein